MKFEIVLNDLASLLHAIHHIPPHTPNRWEDVAACVRSASHSGTTESKSASTVLGDKGKVTIFETTSKVCQTLYDKIICEQYPNLLRRDFVISPPPGVQMTVQML